MSFFVPCNLVLSNPDTIFECSGSFVADLLPAESYELIVHLYEAVCYLEAVIQYNRSTFFFKGIVGVDGRRMYAMPGLAEQVDLLENIPGLGTRNGNIIEPFVQGLKENEFPFCQEAGELADRSERLNESQREFLLLSTTWHTFHKLFTL